MSIPSIKTSFAAGEIAPALWGHVDLQKFSIAASTLRNCFVNYRGGAYSRAGTAFVARSMQNPANGDSPPRLITFQFNINQGYALEFGNGYMRVYSDGAPVIENELTITGITQATPAVVTVTNSYANGDWVFISEVSGMTEVNGQTYIVQGATGSTIQLYTLDGVPLNSSSFPAYTSGGQIARIYTLTTAYGAGDLPLLKFTQSADVMTLTHPNYPPSDLTRIAADNWTLVTTTFGTSVSAPTGLTLTPTVTPSGSLLATSYAAVVTSVTTGGEESIASSVANTTNSVDISATAGSLVTAWSSATGASYYNIYLAPASYNTGANVPTGSLFGLIGSTYGTSFVDSNVTPDFSQVPPLHNNPFTGTGNYPGCVAYFQQRRVYASTLSNPDTYWMSQPGLFTNFDARVPTVDNDAITGTPWAQQVNGIQFMLAMPGGLVVLTGSSAWQVTGAGGSAVNPQPITPSSQQAQQQAFNGCNNRVPPVGINYDIIYVQAKGSIVRDLSYNYWVNIYTGNDLTVLSSQLFTSFTLVERAWCEEPYKVIWYVRNDGALLSLTYLKEQEVFGWARHDTQGAFYSVCSVTEPPVDALYMVTVRYPTTNPSGMYCIERMDNRIWNSVEECWCVDAALTLPLTYPEADLFASSGSGAVEFTASAAVFSSGDVGSVIRFGAAIATLTSYTDSSHVSGTYDSPVPAGSAFSSGAGGWSIAAPVTQVSGLTHLIGMPVTGLADGIPIVGKTVDSTGSITLDRPASNVVVGLSFTAQIQSVYLDGGQPTIQGRRKNITAVTARVDNSSGLQTGSNQPDGSAQTPPAIAPLWTGMTTVPDQGSTYTSPGGGTVTQLFTGDLRVNVGANWAKPGQVAVQQVNPLPMNITALIPEIMEGDLPEQMISKDQQQSDHRQMPKGPGAWMLQG